MRRVVRGFWGPRQESAEELAARWCTTLEHLARLLPTAGAAAPGSDTGPGAPAGGGPLTTWLTVPVSGRPADVLRLPHPDRVAPGEEFRESLLRAVRSAQEDDGWSAADGTSLRLLADTSDGRRVELAGLAGGTPEFLLQSLVATFVVPDDEPLPGAGLLAAVAEAWDPDYGDVGDRAVTAALKKEAGFRTGTPSVGPVAYLSPGRAALVPEEWAARGRRLPGGGLLLELADPGDTAEVVRAHRALKNAGALEPLPRPMDRPAL
ncbi:hypothetical protein ACFTXK_26680 [Streptomyces sp. NPDC056956]|uniref:hypothetical protein n=1 Tax=unclassified Streptomyces TaxID=2593676 RepID=UPI001960A15C|nr:hypothetical protein [Streptomyces sp. S12]